MTELFSEWMLLWQGRTRVAGLPPFGRLWCRNFLDTTWVYQFADSLSEDGIHWSEVRSAPDKKFYIAMILDLIAVGKLVPGNAPPNDGKNGYVGRGERGLSD